jgi:hypothetical protein
MNDQNRPLRHFLVALLAAGPGQAYASPTPAPHATAAGGSYQLNALEGCMNQWVFNGIWRVRIQKMTPIMRPMTEFPGFALTVEFRNGAHKTTSLASTGVPLMGGAGNLVMDDGSPLDFYVPENTSWATYYVQSLPPGAGFTTDLKYFYDVKPANIGKPDRWLFEVDPTKEWTGSPKYTTSQPSLRVRLTCG